jgi:hypothetical protein
MAGLFSVNLSSHCFFWSPWWPPGPKFDFIQILHSNVNQRSLWQRWCSISSLSASADAKYGVTLTSWCWNSNISESANAEWVHSLSNCADGESAVSLTALKQKPRTPWQCWCWISNISESVDAKLIVSLTNAESAVSLITLMVNQQCLWQRWCWINPLPDSTDSDHEPQHYWEQKNVRTYT